MANPPPPQQPRPALAQDLWLGPLRLGARLERWPPAWLARARALGAHAVELPPPLEASPAELAAVLDGHGLALAGAACAGGLLELSQAAERQRLAPLLERSLAAGNPLLLYTEFSRQIRDDDIATLADRPRLRHDDLRRYGEQLTRLADWLAGEGGRLAYLPRPGTVIDGAAEIDLLLDATDTSVGLALDSGAVALADAENDLAALLLRHRARLRHLRLQAVDPERLERARAQGWSCRRLLAEVPAPPRPDMASPEPALLAAALREIGYEGWLVAASERRQADPEAAAAAALEALAACLP
ncbi:MAG: TIM barrel protein [Geminicoccaceae bacterium]